MDGIHRIQRVRGDNVTRGKSFLMVRMSRLPAKLRQPKRFLIAVCLFALALRVGAMLAGSTYRVLVDDTQFFGFGWEIGRVAASVAAGKGFSSPLPEPTGPTTIVGPVYPLILALVFKLFGVYSTGSAIVIRVLQSIFSAVTCVFLYLCGRDTVGKETGKVAALAWAVFPLNIFFTVNKVWETSLTSLLAVILFWCLLMVRKSISMRRWALVGALLGVVALTSASLVMFAVPFGIWALLKHRLRVLPALAVGVLACLAVVSPWLLRNHREFGKLMLRSNFPLEFRIGNNTSSFGQKIEALHPSNTPSVNRHWQEVGEVRFMAEEQAENAKFISAQPGRFAFSTFNRLINYWTGAWIRVIPGYPNNWPVITATSFLTLAGVFGLWQMAASRLSVLWLYAGCLNMYPITYYFTTTQPRFYHAVTPLLILCASFGLTCSVRLRPLRTGFSRVVGSRHRSECRVYPETEVSLRRGQILEREAPTW
jgi:hypothetical protein